ncbi:hypothetical protein B0H16DRAFT_467474 [Mycena metata]|uniref:Uncharacterized protein n=1 Tax=Mycena metata TaxID=1033252 RepID=A0AAD7KCX7_9AGAR|nr:hypothetical protein B0H16DRAFT_467474 [Mycena metata]
MALRGAPTVPSKTSAWPCAFRRTEAPAMEGRRDQRHCRRSCQNLWVQALGRLPTFRQRRSRAALWTAMSASVQPSASFYWRNWVSWTSRPVCRGKANRRLFDIHISRLPWKRNSSGSFCLQPASLYSSFPRIRPSQRKKIMHKPRSAGK